VFLQYKPTLILSVVFWPR